MAEVFSQEWREEHATAGDQALGIARQVADTETGHTITLAAVASAFAAIAQAHYAAANVRARAAAGPAELRTRTPYVIPGVEGIWEIRGMTTTDMGRGEPTELQLFRVDR